MDIEKIAQITSRLGKVEGNARKPDVIVEKSITSGKCATPERRK